MADPWKKRVTRLWSKVWATERKIYRYREQLQKLYLDHLKTRGPLPAYVPTEPHVRFQPPEDSLE